MRFLIHAATAIALAASAATHAQAQDQAPACRADLDGNQLTTTIEFNDGYAVEAPWSLSWNRAAALPDGRTGVAAAARLDRIVEVDPSTGQRIVTPFPEPIETTFEGGTEEELMYQAAQIWCLTVIKAQEREHGARQPATAPRRGAVGAVGL